MTITAPISQHGLSGYLYQHVLRGTKLRIEINLPIWNIKKKEEGIPVDTRFGFLLVSHSTDIHIYVFTLDLTLSIHDK